jgi:hypothetical protein
MTDYGGCGDSSRNHGIEILSHDKGSFLVQSGTNREDYYMVEFATDEVGDITGCSCTCPSYQFRKECFHIRYLCKLLGVETPKPTNQLIAA